MFGVYRRAILGWLCASVWDRKLTHYILTSSSIAQLLIKFFIALHCIIQVGNRSAGKLIGFCNTCWKICRRNSSGFIKQFKDSGMKKQSQQHASGEKKLVAVIKNRWFIGNETKPPTEHFNCIFLNNCAGALCVCVFINARYCFAFEFLNWMR